MYFFRDDMSGLNFPYAHRPLREILATLLEDRGQPEPPAICTGATVLEETLPQMARECTLDIPDKPARPRMWLGNDCGNALRQL